MYNLHPPITSFPCALLCVALALELLSIKYNSIAIKSAASINLFIGLAGVVAAFFTGYQASEMADKTFIVPDSAISSHQSIARLLLFLVVPLLGLWFAKEKGKFNREIFATVFRILLIIAVCMVVYTGYLGGALVFEYGAGVEIVKPSTELGASVSVP